MAQHATSYRLMVRLAGSEPPIWRRLEVRASITFARLHRVLQAAMGWTDQQWFQFEVGRELITTPERLVSWFERAGLDAETARLERHLEQEGQELTYLYGNNWEHLVRVEEIVTQANVAAPVCLQGRRACPPEHCGGMQGYANLLRALEDAAHPEHGELSAWAGDFDPERFDLAIANRQLARV